ncbi:adp-ribosylation factor gtpase activating protein 3 isoform h [Anaeramoeba flamelloides]|uniref:Adp-ribosylation factor gtpase activating protein 3 isoform h n=1 Tax=Anaeramoeba flamelloides TaxID=1746091 RepID=A0AAV7YSF6_9EUKA|nr:adp-ribosylation factor gtpase activating protein 3 isoform h [Anaeramoeba flamelloides]
MSSVIEKYKNYKQVLRRIRAQQGNSMCIDCGMKDNSWATVTYGTFLCIECAGVHRSLGVHLSFVRSCTLDTWSPEQLRRMELGGNKNLMNQFKKSHLHKEPNQRKKYQSRAAKVYKDKLDKVCKNDEIYNTLICTSKKGIPNNSKKTQQKKQTTQKKIKEKEQDFFQEQFKETSKNNNVNKTHNKQLQTNTNYLKNPKVSNIRKDSDYLSRSQPLSRNKNKILFNSRRNSSGMSLGVYSKSRSVPNFEEDSSFSSEEEVIQKKHEIKKSEDKIDNNKNLKNENDSDNENDNDNDNDNDGWGFFEEFEKELEQKSSRKPKHKNMHKNNLKTSKSLNNNVYNQNKVYGKQPQFNSQSRNNSQFSNENNNMNNKNNNMLPDWDEVQQKASTAINFLSGESKKLFHSAKGWGSNIMKFFDEEKGSTNSNTSNSSYDNSNIYHNNSQQQYSTHNNYQKSFQKISNGGNGSQNRESFGNKNKTTSNNHESTKNQMKIKEKVKRVLEVEEEQVVGDEKETVVEEEEEDWFEKGWKDF